MRRVLGPSDGFRGRLRDVMERHNAEQEKCTSCGKPRRGFQMAIGPIVQSGVGQYSAQRTQTRDEAGLCTCAEATP